MGCDAKVHATGKLGSRHERMWMCEVYEQAPTSVTCKADTAALCVICDRDIHSANPWYEPRGIFRCTVKSELTDEMEPTTSILGADVNRYLAPAPVIEAPAKAAQPKGRHFRGVRQQPWGKLAAEIRDPAKNGATPEGIKGENKIAATTHRERLQIRTL